MPAYPKGNEVNDDSNTLGAWKQLFSTATTGRKYIEAGCSSLAGVDAMFATRPVGSGAPAGLTEGYAHKIVYKGDKGQFINADANTEIWYTGVGGAVTIVTVREMVDR
jgi:hypothetical protein